MISKTSIFYSRTKGQHFGSGAFIRLASTMAEISIGVFGIRGRMGDL